MMVVVTYDISTIDRAGQRRLRKISKICQNYGQRVQHSVFECIIDSTEFATMKHQLLQAINEEKDSIRFYQIGNQYRKKVEQVGVKETIFVEDPFIF
ncbi:CRISPR-associated endonuclease Cas2 [Bacillus xiamenensis]|uniref:CRISPR-associated endoribonuclease Cas2 n=1 Tax=Bacillus xiamenensis TaxID=1178537 RepID=A0AAC9IJ75_9BACI|nr:CRISPR-associated endonuclease Cas2 [Bacillus xiamenensis]AOZ90725.1 CRISPR-associated endonuclease Cas2 [Bacillus xiamenensis]EKF36602.1 hypothetical protein BA1_04472 [Bacillus xiamenensis]MBG9911183.1 CRISPR-associated protein Cas2 [Bacillus xiamenensis]MCW1838108.1 CRISPR-associated endonuclease Cas2 [Bacillus xiamenensis]MCY9575476.1 CRISPR-associated endonuclease Cas2 [Bacillus xiamenensis]